MVKRKRYKWKEEEQAQKRLILSEGKDAHGGSGVGKAWSGQGDNGGSGSNGEIHRLGHMRQWRDSFGSGRRNRSGRKKRSILLMTLLKVMGEENGKQKGKEERKAWGYDRRESKSSVIRGIKEKKRGEREGESRGKKKRKKKGRGKERLWIWVKKRKKKEWRGAL